MTDTDTTAATTPDRILRIVQGLLAKASDAAATPEEAEACHAKAHALMKKYAMAEEELRETQPDSLRAKPVVRVFRVCQYGSQFASKYASMVYAAAQHADVRMVTSYKNGDLLAHVVGYDADCRFAEMLFVSAFLVFQENLEPEFDPNASDELNSFRLRNAGKTRREIAVKLWGREVDRSVPAHQKVQKFYEAEAARRGITIVAGRGVSRAAFIKVYAESFVSKFSQRLYTARDASDSDNGVLVLANRAERVTDAFYDAFPDMRPSTAVEVSEPWVDSRTEAQKARDERRYQKDAQARRDLHRSAAGRAGWAAGNAAADKIEISGVARAKRIEGQ